MAGLGLRFPVAEISRRTGESKGNISSYLNGKKPVPENFFTTLNTAFKDYEPIPGNFMQEEKPSQNDDRAELREAMATIRSYNSFLQRMLESSLEKILRDQVGSSALIGELLRRDIQREADGNPEIEKQILDRLLQRIGTKLSSNVKEDIAVGDGN